MANILKRVEEFLAGGDECPECGHQRGECCCSEELLTELYSFMKMIQPNNMIRFGFYNENNLRAGDICTDEDELDSGDVTEEVFDVHTVEEAHKILTYYDQHIQLLENSKPCKYYAKKMGPGAAFKLKVFKNIRAHLSEQFKDRKYKW